MKRVLVVLLVVMAALAGCTQPQPSTAVATGPTVLSQASATATPSPVDLIALRHAAGIPDCPASSSLPAVQGGLPDVELACLGGGSTLRLGGLRGPMIVNFWAQWCPPCRSEAPEIREFNQLAAGKVTLIGIDGNDPREDYAVEFAAIEGWTYAQLYDPDKKSMAPLGLNSLPHSLFIDANGVVVYHYVGAFGSVDQMRQLTAQYLKVTV
ncbi:MAG TPA: TlpA disulfide reductase family protein [Propionibacteriaceae bacterium]